MFCLGGARDSLLGLCQTMIRKKSQNPVFMQELWLPVLQAGVACRGADRPALLHGGYGGHARAMQGAGSLTCMLPLLIYASTLVSIATMGSDAA